MQNYDIILKSKLPDDFRSQKVINLFDLDTEEKLSHRLNITADVESDYQIGFIFGASGSGKTTLAKKIYGNFESELESIDYSKNIISQMNQELTFDSCSKILNAIGLSSYPCWIKPLSSLSNRQRSRALIAYQFSFKDFIVIDEFTSLVDRETAKAMSYSISKYIRNSNKKVIFISCHYDVIDWLNPCFIIDCNKQEYIDRRVLWQSFKREEKLKFDIKQCDRSEWKNFSKYHYLSSQQPVGHFYCFGLFLNKKQVGFCAFSNYVPKRKNKKMILHSNRLVLLPEFQGLGIGLKFVDNCASYLKDKGYEIYAKFSSIPMYKARIKSSRWELISIKRDMIRKSALNNKSRTMVKTYSFKFIS